MSESIPQTVTETLSSSPPDARTVIQQLLARFNEGHSYSAEEEEAERERMEKEIARRATLTYDDIFLNRPEDIINKLLQEKAELKARDAKATFPNHHYVEISMVDYNEKFFDNRNAHMSHMGGGSSESGGRVLMYALPADLTGVAHVVISSDPQKMVDEKKEFMLEQLEGNIEKMLDVIEKYYDEAGIKAQQLLAALRKK